MMSSLSEWLILYLVNYFFFFLEGAIALLIFNRQLLWKRLLFFALINAMGRNLIIILLPGYIAWAFMFIYSFLMAVTLYLVLKLRFVQCVIATLLLILLGTILNYTNLAILKIAVGDNYTIGNWMNQFINTVLAMSLNNLLLFSTALFIYYLKIKVNIPGQMDRKKILGFILYIIVTVLTVVPNMLFYEKAAALVPIELFIFNGASVFILIFLGLHNILTSGRLETKSQEVELQKLYINTLQDSIDGMRSFKHDYNNMVQVIGGYLELGDYEGLKEFHIQMRSEIHRVNNTIPLNTYILSVPALYGLILSKLSFAEARDILFTIKCTCTVKTGEIKLYDFCKILGVLLDNALEAALNSDERYAELELYENTKLNTMVIKVANTFKGEVKLDRIFDNGYTTKENHCGFGLWEAKRLVSKYGSCTLNTKITGNILEHKIEIIL